MIKRMLSLPKHQSLLLFGARSTGKSTLLRELYHGDDVIWFDLLNLELEDQLSRNPQELKSILQAQTQKIKYVVIDEIQKIPSLLDVVHQLIETTSLHFIMSGSSAKKLKQGGANLLAGRALVYNLFPFSYLELGKKFSLPSALNWGTLPKINTFKTNELKLKFLQTYALTYLKEEIWAEQLVRRLSTFRNFLEVSAQCNGKIINYAKIARDVNADDKTIHAYFNILEDTLIGFHLNAFKHSFRKRLSEKPKFYYFDIGVCRALSRTLSISTQQGTSYYGELFEHFIILEIYKLCAYYYPEYRLSYLQTKDGVEIDLVVERPQKKLLFIELKSASNIDETKLTAFKTITKDFGECEAICLSQIPLAKQYDHVTVLPWHMGLQRYFPPLPTK